jgi:gliding motility-associated-like protein
MYRGELLFFLLVVEFFSLDFLKGRANAFFDFITLPPKITQWETDSCTRTISIQSVAGGIPPYDFYVFKQDSLDSSNWQVYRLIKEQLPQIAGLPPGTYRIKAVNEGVTSPSTSTNFLAVNFPSDPEIEVKGSTSLCSGRSPDLALQLLNSEVFLTFRWTARVLQEPEEGKLQGYSSNPTAPLLGIRDTLVNTGTSVAKVEYRVQPIVGDCMLPSQLVEVLVDPLPRVVAKASQQLVCSGVPFSISLVAESWGNSPMQLRWTSEVLSGQVLGLEEQGLLAVSPLIQALSNRGTIPARIRYTFFPSFNRCEGLPESVEIVVLPLLKLAAQQDLIFCPGEWVSLPVFSTESTGLVINYLWEVSGPSIGLENATGKGAQIPAFLAANAGTIPKQTRITVTPIIEDIENEISCMGTPSSFLVTIRAPIQVLEELSNYGGYGVSCAGASDGKIKLHLSGGLLPGEEFSYQFTWTGPEGFLSSSPSLEGVKAGVYRVQVSVGGNCVFEKSVEITQPKPLQISQSLLNNLCFQGISGSLLVTPSGGVPPYSYAWAGPNGYSSRLPNPQNLGSGTYQVTVTDANGCILIGAPQTIIEPAQLALTQNKVDNVCFQGTSGRISITASGGTAPYSYAWTGPDNFSAAVANPQNLGSGTYQVTVRDANNCTVLVSPQITITEPSPIALTQSKVDNVCFQGNTGSITIIPSGGTAPYTYSWTGPNNFSSTLSNPQNLGSGTYQVTVKDANNCTAMVGPQITITEPSPIALTQSKVDNVCFQGNTGSISITAIGGTAPYSYAWTGPNNFSATVANPQNLGSGTYQVTVRDANNCTALVGPQITITEPPTLTINAQIQAESCANAKDGRIELTLSGGMPPYTLAWEHGGTDALASGLGAGTYRVRVTDQAGCSQAGEYTLLPIPPLSLQTTTTLQATQVPLQISALLQAQATGGTPPYTYSWNTGGVNSQISVAQSGVYRVVVQDSKGCKLESQVTVNVPVPMSLSLNVKTVPLCEEDGQETTVQLQLTGGLAPYQITWSRGAPSSDGRTLVTRELGVFEVEVKDALGLIEKRTFTVDPRNTGPLEFTYLFASQADFQADLARFIVKFLPTATWPFEVISWDFGDGNSSAGSAPTHRYATKGTYSVTLTVLDAAGCLLKATKQILVQDYFLEIPNVFTPNGDQLNDTFFPKYKFIKNLQLQVMNKWGELIYSSSGQKNPGWDGLVSGQKAPEGVYVYTLHYQVPDGRTITSSSTFLLAR